VGEARVCAGCGQPVTEDDLAVEYREVIGLQEWKSSYYHTACAPVEEGAFRSCRRLSDPGKE